MKKHQLKISDLSARHPGVSDAIGPGLAEAAAVCLDRHHEAPMDFSTDDAGALHTATVDWPMVDDRIRGAWGNEIDATENGACAMVLAATELLRGHVAVRRAETGSGADYYLGPPGTGADDLEDCIRLEVSGTDRGALSDLERRLIQKIQQTRRGASNLPAMAGVVGFELGRIMLSEVESAA